MVATYMYVADQLRFNFNTVLCNRPISEHYEVYRRLAIWYNLWLSKWEGREKPVAQEAVDSLYTYSKNVNQSILLTIADGLENENDLPDFIKNNIDVFTECCKYLAFGNAELERGLDDSILKVAEQFALDRIKGSLNDQL